MPNGSPNTQDSSLDLQKNQNFQSILDEAKKAYDEGNVDKAYDLAQDLDDLLGHGVETFVMKANTAHFRQRVGDLIEHDFLQDKHESATKKSIHKVLEKTHQHLAKHANPNEVESPFDIPKKEEGEDIKVTKLASDENPEETLVNQTENAEDLPFEKVETDDSPYDHEGNLLKTTELHTETPDEAHTAHSSLESEDDSDLPYQVEARAEQDPDFFDPNKGDFSRELYPSAPERPATFETREFIPVEPTEELITPEATDETKWEFMAKMRAGNIAKDEFNKLEEVQEALRNNNYRKFGLTQKEFFEFKSRLKQWGYGSLVNKKGIDSLVTICRSDFLSPGTIKEVLKNKIAEITKIVLKVVADSDATASEAVDRKGILALPKSRIRSGNELSVKPSAKTNDQPKSEAELMLEEIENPATPTNAKTDEAAQLLKEFTQEKPKSAEDLPSGTVAELEQKLNGRRLTKQHKLSTLRDEPGAKSAEEVQQNLADHNELTDQDYDDILAQIKAESPQAPNKTAEIKIEPTSIEDPRTTEQLKGLDTVLGREMAREYLEDFKEIKRVLSKAKAELDQGKTTSAIIILTQNHQTFTELDSILKKQRTDITSEQYTEIFKALATNQEVQDAFRLMEGFIFTQPKGRLAELISPYYTALKPYIEPNQPEASEAKEEEEFSAETTNRDVIRKKLETVGDFVDLTTIFTARQLREVGQIMAEGEMRANFQLHHAFVLLAEHYGMQWEDLMSSTQNEIMAYYIPGTERKVLDDALYQICKTRKTNKDEFINNLKSINAIMLIQLKRADRKLSRSEGKEALFGQSDFNALAKGEWREDGGPVNAEVNTDSLLDLDDYELNQMLTKHARKEYYELDELYRALTLEGHFALTHGYDRPGLSQSKRLIGDENRSISQQLTERQKKVLGIEDEDQLAMIRQHLNDSEIGAFMRAETTTEAIRSLLEGQVTVLDLEEKLKEILEKVKRLIEEAKEETEWVVEEGDDTVVDAAHVGTEPVDAETGQAAIERNRRPNAPDVRDFIDLLLIKPESVRLGDPAIRVIDDLYEQMVEQGRHKELITFMKNPDLMGASANYPLINENYKKLFDEDIDAENASVMTLKGYLKELQDEDEILKESARGSFNQRQENVTRRRLIRKAIGELKGAIQLKGKTKKFRSPREIVGTMLMFMHLEDDEYSISNLTIEANRLIGQYENFDEGRTKSLFKTALRSGLKSSLQVIAQDEYFSEWGDDPGKHLESLGKGSVARDVRKVKGWIKKLPGKEKNVYTTIPRLIEYLKFAMHHGQITGWTGNEVPKLLIQNLERAREDIIRQEINDLAEEKGWDDKQKMREYIMRLNKGTEHVHEIWEEEGTILGRNALTYHHWKTVGKRGVYGIGTAAGVGAAMVAWPYVLGAGAIAAGVKYNKQLAAVAKGTGKAIEMTYKGGKILTKDLIVPGAKVTGKVVGKTVEVGTGATRGVLGTGLWAAGGLLWPPGLLTKKKWAKLANKWQPLGKSFGMKPSSTSFNPPPSPPQQPNA